MNDDQTKRFTQKVGVRRFTDRTTRETTVHSAVFKVRWLEGVLVIESVVSRIDRDDVLLDVFAQSLTKEPEGIILHLPRPRYISSLLIVAVRDMSRKAKELKMPLLVVMHPKLQLLFEMFGLKSTVRMGESLDGSLRTLHKEIERRHAEEGIRPKEL